MHKPNSHTTDTDNNQTQENLDTHPSEFIMSQPQHKPTWRRTTVWNCCDCRSNNQMRWHPVTCNRLGCFHHKCSACIVTVEWSDKP